MQGVGGLDAKICISSRENLWQFKNDRTVNKSTKDQ